MTRLAGAVVGMAAAALVMAYLAFGWPILLLGGPLFIGVAITVGGLVLTEHPRAVLRERRGRRHDDSPWRTAAERGEKPADGLMSGFFETSPQPAPEPVTRPAAEAVTQPAPEPARLPATGIAARAGRAVPGQRPAPVTARPAGAR